MARRNLRANFSTRSGFGINAFTDNELKAIHFATLEVLQTTGVKVESDKALEIFHGAGARVEQHDGYGIVKIPNYIVEDCIRWAPRIGGYYGRRPEDDYITDGARVGFSAGFGEQVKIIDLDTKKVRSTVKKDLADITRIQDYLDVITVIERAACSGDQPPATQTLHNYEAMVQNSSKHCFLGFGGGKNAEKIIEMAKIAAGGEDKFKNRPIVTGFVCPTSPLTMVRDCCETIMTCAESGVGIAVISMSLSGASSAATLGSVVVQHNAEVLSGIVLAQLTARGTPCTYCGCSTIMDMRSGLSPVGVPEMGLLSVAWAKLAQYYQLPSLVGGCGSDSKLPDAQQAYDFSLTAMPAALAGANIIYGIGAIESILTFDYAAMIMGAEQAKRIMRVVGGIDISDDAMALDLIHEIGPGGQFLTHEHTYRHMREMSQSELFDRRTRDAWMKATDGINVAERAYEEAGRIISEHTPAPLPEGAATAMRAIIKEYEAELGL
ncbi:MAG: trimethylamine methyltransferase family protein [Deltaproteobacteria bacterium]|nr:trimethylamine methyltransferase family protein [Deltaproteobacteria bacterium]